MIPNLSGILLFLSSDSVDESMSFLVKQFWSKELNASISISGWYKINRRYLGFFQWNGWDDDTFFLHCIAYIHLSLASWAICFLLWLLSSLRLLCKLWEEKTEPSACDDWPSIVIISIPYSCERNWRSIEIIQLYLRNVSLASANINDGLHIIDFLKVVDQRCEWLDFVEFLWGHTHWEHGIQFHDCGCLIS